MCNLDLHNWWQPSPFILADDHHYFLRNSTRPRVLFSPKNDLHRPEVNSTSNDPHPSGGSTPDLAAAFRDLCDRPQNVKADSVFDLRDLYTDSDSDDLDRDLPAPEHIGQGHNMAQDNRLLAAVAMQPTKFNGSKPEKGAQWWNAFDRYAHFAGIEGEHKARMLGMLMSGIALHWYESLPAATQTDAALVEVAFREKYIEAGPDMLQQQIDALSKQQQASESVEEFAAETKTRLANLGYNPNQQMTIIINGLRPDIKSVVLQHLPFATVEALINKAKHVEQALKSYIKGDATKRPDDEKDKDVRAAIEKLTANVTAIQRAVETRTSHPNRGRGFSQTQRSRQLDPNERRCFLCNSPHHLQRDCKQNQSQQQRQCYNCGSPNHIKRNCPGNQPQWQGQSQYSGQGRPNWQGQSQPSWQGQGQPNWQGQGQPSWQGQGHGGYNQRYNGRQMQGRSQRNQWEN